MTVAHGEFTSLNRSNHPINPPPEPTYATIETSEKDYDAESYREAPTISQPHLHLEGYETSSSSEDEPELPVPTQDPLWFHKFTQDWYERLREHRVQPKLLIQANSSPANPGSL